LKIKICFLVITLFIGHGILYGSDKYIFDESGFNFPHDFRGIIHLHSHLSHDSHGKFEDIDKAAAHHNIDFIVMSDHWSESVFKKSRKGFYHNTLFIPGSELSKRSGVTLLTIPLPENFKPNSSWQEDAMQLKKGGAIVFADHIEWSKNDQLEALDGIELTNLHAHILEQSIPRLIVNYVRVLNPFNWNLAFLFKDVDNLKRWYALEKKNNRIIPAFFGNDSHDNYRLFKFFGPKLASYDRTFRLLTTHIWANDLSEANVLDALERGQSYFAFEIFGNTTGFHFYIADEKEAYFPGSKIILKENLKLIIKAPVGARVDPQKLKMKIIRDGKVYKEADGLIMAEKLTQPGLYHAEIWNDGKPWIFSNSILIEQR